MKKTLWFILFSLLTLFGQATAEKNNWSILPIFSSSPETGFAAGVFGINNYHLPDQTNAYRFPSSFIPFALFTEKKQTLFFIFSDHFFKQSPWRMKSRWMFSDFPDTFFGVGSSSTYEAFSSRALETEIKLIRENSEQLGFGPVLFLKSYKVAQTEIGGQLASGIIRGSNDNEDLISGLGWISTYDSRDSLYKPTRGLYTEFKNMHFRTYLGSDFNFDQYTFEIKNYNQIKKNHIIAIQGVFQSTLGDAPFYEMATLGGPQVMRGLQSGEQRDRHKLYTQIELRLYELWNKLGVFGLFSTGATFDNHHNVKKGQTYGFGLRFPINENNLNFRIDFAYGGREGQSVYVTVGEAF